MGVLVEDLLTLARLDEAPELQPEPVDVAALAGDAVEDARATAPTATIELARDRPSGRLGDPSPAAPGARQPDPQRDHAHARRHADRGRARAATRRRSRSAFATTDRACRPSAGSDLFERFWRAEGGRERGRAGAGLGPVDRPGRRRGPPWPDQRRATRPTGAPCSSCAYPSQRRSYLPRAPPEPPPSEPRASQASLLGYAHSELRRDLDSGWQ